MNKVVVVEGNFLDNRKFIQEVGRREKRRSKAMEQKRVRKKMVKK